MTHNTRRAVIACMLAATITAWAQTTETEAWLPSAAIAQQFKSVFAPQCKLMHNPPRAASGADGPRAAEDAAVVNTQATMCECVTQEADAWVASVGGDGTVTQAQASEAGQRISNACTARSIRGAMTSSCTNGLDPFARRGDAPVSEDRRRARCACMQAGVEKLDDAQITQSSLASYRDYVAKAKARRAGEPDPAPTPSPMAAVEQACRAQDAQR